MAQPLRLRFRKPVDRGMQDVGHGLGAGENRDVELDEVAALLLPERSDFRAGRERGADPRATQVAHYAADVDPRSDDDVGAESAVAQLRVEGRLAPCLPPSIP